MSAAHSRRGAKQPRRLCPRISSSERRRHSLRVRALEQEHGNAERVVARLDQSQVRYRDGQERVPRDGREASRVDEQDVLPGSERALDRGPGVSRVRARSRGDVPAVHVPRVSERRSAHRSLRRRLGELHGDQEERGDQLDGRGRPRRPKRTCPPGLSSAPPRPRRGANTTVLPKSRKVRRAVSLMISRARTPRGASSRFFARKNVFNENPPVSTLSSVHPVVDPRALGAGGSGFRSSAGGAAGISKGAVSEEESTRSRVRVRRRRSRPRARTAKGMPPRRARSEHARAPRARARSREERPKASRVTTSIGATRDETRAAVPPLAPRRAPRTPRAPPRTLRARPKPTSSATRADASTSASATCSSPSRYFRYFHSSTTHNSSSASSQYVTPRCLPANGVASLARAPKETACPASRSR